MGIEDAVPSWRLPHEPDRTVSTWRHRIEGWPLATKGAVGVAAGMLLLTWPSPAVRTIEVVFGVAVLALAALDLVEVLRRGAGGALLGRLAEIAIEVALGALLLAWPDLSRLAILWAIGMASIVLAFLEAASLTATGRSERDRWLGGAASAAALVFGIALLSLPWRSFDAMVAALGLYLVILGTLRLIRALAARRRREPAHG